MRYLPRVGVAAKRQVGDHLLVGELVPLGTLDDAIQNQHVAVGFTAGRVTVGDVGPGARGERVPARPGCAPWPPRGPGVGRRGDTWQAGHEWGLGGPRGPLG